MSKSKHTMFRIESAETSSGMYRASSTAHQMQGNSTGHPGPFDDALLVTGMFAEGFLPHRIPREYVFGFESEKQLRRWIYKDSWLQGLHDEGMVLALIEVDDYVIGHTQAIFKRTANVEIHSIKDYFKLTGENNET
jgi:hypothetical protein